MPFYSFQLNVPAPPDIVSERVRRVVQPGRSVWALAQAAWTTPSTSALPFVGTVENRSFQIRRLIQSRNAFMPIIRGTIVPTPAGSTVKVFMFMHPLALTFMLIWLGFLVHIESRVVDANIARSFLPLGMIVFGIVLSLGGFFFEAMKVAPALSAAVFDSSAAATGRDPAPDATAQQFRANQIALNKRIVSIAAVAAVAGAIGLLIFHTVSLSSSRAATMAMVLLSQSADARAALGQPIKAGIAVDGIVEDDAAAGAAILSIPVSGPAGKGLLYVVANRDRGDWDIEREVLQVGTGRAKIDLTPPTRREPFQYPATGRIYLLPLDDAAATLIKDFPAYYKARLDADARLLPTQPLTPDLIGADGKQAIAERVLMAMSVKQTVINEEPDAVLVGVTSQDINFQSLNLAYATNLRMGRISVITMARLSELPWNAGHNPEVMMIRVRKMITRTIGLLRYPLDVSSDVTSAVSSQASTPAEIDQMGESFAGQDGTAGFEAAGAPCVSIIQSANGIQAWRLGCIGNNRPDSRLEHFEVYSNGQLPVTSRADFEFKDQPQFPFVRKYRPKDDRSRSFGIGATDSFDIGPVGDSETFAWIELILADGEPIHFVRTSQGTGYVNAEYLGPRSLGDPFSLSKLRWNGNGWDISRRDGWTYVFPSSGPDRTFLQGALTGLRSDSGQVFTIHRDANSNLTEVRTPGGESLKLTHDADQRITSGVQSSGRTVQYEYDGKGRLAHMRDSQGGEEYYEYDEGNRLTAIRDSQHRTTLANTYDTTGQITSQTLADGRKIIYEFGFDQNSKLTFVRLTFPNGYSIIWQLTRAGFVRTWPRPPANPGAGTPTEQSKR